MKNVILAFCMFLSFSVMASEGCVIAKATFNDQVIDLDPQTKEVAPFLVNNGKDGELTVSIMTNNKLVFGNDSPIMKLEADNGDKEVYISDYLHGAEYVWAYNPKSEKRIIIMNIRNPKTGYVVVCK